jgi:hypothetical protein
MEVVNRLVPPCIVAVLAGALASCSNDDGRAETGAVGCTPGAQVGCACVGGALEGVQICDPSGAGFGPCMGCGESTGDASSGATSIDAETAADSSADMSATTPMESAGEMTGPPGGSESGSAGFAWVWVDHGGPAFLPPPCSASAGVVDGLLVDPQAFFDALVAGADPNDWVSVMNAIEPQLWMCGVGQQRDVGGNVRGRLFLPTDACPDASPPADDPEAMFLGVRQESACWTHFVDVVAEI